MYKNSKKINFQWGYQDLMQYRIHEILLVSSPYDSFILEEDGNLSEQILHEFQGMNLSYAPRIWSADTAKNALELLNSRNFDLVIVMLRIADTDPVSFSKKIKSANYSIDTYKKKIYIYGIAETKEEQSLVIEEAKQILDVEDVISSILLLEDLRIQKN